MNAPRFEPFQDNAGGWRWRLLAANNRIIADSGESYTRKEDAERAVGTVIETVIEVAQEIAAEASS